MNEAQRKAIAQRQQRIVQDLNFLKRHSDALLEAYRKTCGQIAKRTQELIDLEEAPLQEFLHGFPLANETEPHVLIVECAITCNDDDDEDWEDDEYGC